MGPARGEPEAARPWWRDAVFYQILVDRFRRPGAEPPLRDPALPVFCGGDLRGVAEALDYLRRLGVSALWLSPIQRTASYHGYHLTDFRRVEPRFGGLPALRALLRAARPDLRIVMDWVPNHVHRSHPFFREALARPSSRYRDWFCFGADGTWKSFLDFTDLPKLNLEHPEARRYVIDCALAWLDLGVSGFRLNHVLGPSLGFWRAFRDAVRAHGRSTFLVVGEALFLGVRREHLGTLHLPHKRRHLRDAERGLPVADPVMAEYAGVFDGLLDFGFCDILREEVAQAAALPAAAAVQPRLDAHYRAFPAGLCLPSFLDNHDLDRFLFLAGGDKARLRRAAEIQFRQDQPPILYYGTELGLGQARAIAGPYGDLEARRMMPWAGGDPDLLRFYTELIQDRRRRQDAAVRASV
jgi:glycosidase